MTDPTVTLTWHGDIDLAVCPRLNADIDEALATGSPTTLVLDLSEVGFIDSTGIGTLVRAQNRCTERGVTVRLRAARPAVKRVLQLTGLTDRFRYDDPHPTSPPAPEQLPSDARMPAAPDEKFDRVAALCARMMQTRTALVSLVDESQQVFPGAVGLPEPWQEQRSTPLTHSFCQYVVDRGAPLVITDARNDPLLSQNLAIPDLGVVAYAGMPLIDLDGRVVGSLCAIDSVPRHWTDAELRDLEDLADICSSELQARSAERRMTLINERDRFARRVERETVRHLMAVSMTLGAALSVAEGEAVRHIRQALDRMDLAMTTLREVVYDTNRADPPGAESPVAATP